jgi:hypothetical protein
MSSSMALHPGDTVALTILTEPATRREGQIHGRNHACIELISDVPAAPGAAVKLERESELFLGEVRFCRQTHGGYALDIGLRHAIYDTVELARLAHKLLDERL